jgi:hypothetical protein
VLLSIDSNSEASSSIDPLLEIIVLAVIKTSPRRQSWVCAFDDLDRLLQDNHRRWQHGSAWSYDLAGNMLANSGLGAYAYPTQGPGAVRPHTPISINGEGVSYDASGNLLSRGAKSYAYDGENRLANGQPGGGREYSTNDKVHVDRGNLHVTPLYWGSRGHDQSIGRPKVTVRHRRALEFLTIRRSKKFDWRGRFGCTCWSGLDHSEMEIRVGGKDLPFWNAAKPA